MNNEQSPESVFNDIMIDAIAGSATEIQFLQWLANVIVDEGEEPRTRLLAIAVAIHARTKHVA